MTDNTYDDIKARLARNYGYKPWLSGKTKDRQNPGVDSKSRAKEQLEYVTSAMRSMDESDKLDAILIAVSYGNIEDDTRNVLWKSVKNNPNNVSYLLSHMDDYHHSLLLDHGFKYKDSVIDHLIERKDIHTFITFCSYHCDRESSIQNELNKPYVKRMVKHLWDNYAKMHRTYFKDDEVYTPSEFKNVRDFMLKVIPLDEWLNSKPTTAKIKKVISLHALSYRLDAAGDPDVFQSKMDSLIETLSKHERTKWISNNMSAIAVFDLDIMTDAYWNALLTKSNALDTKPTDLVLEF